MRWPWSKPSAKAQAKPEPPTVTFPVFSSERVAARMARETEHALLTKWWMEPLTFEEAERMLQALIPPGCTWFKASLSRERLEGLQDTPTHKAECWYVVVEVQGYRWSSGTGIGLGWDGGEVRDYLEKVLGAIALGLIETVTLAPRERHTTPIPPPPLQEPRP